MYLENIIKYKREEIKTLKLANLTRSRPVLNPLEFLHDRPFIAEIKKASPSRGDINTGVDITGRAVEYERGGAGAISVLTDGKYFKGSFNHLSDISQSVGVPLLCKDFILSEVQIENAYLHGADFVLLIAAILSVGEMMRLSEKAREYGLKVLYELHDIGEFIKIKTLAPGLVGVNARDLSSFKINKRKAMDTMRALRGDFLMVAESGIESPADITDFKNAGADVFLVGTALMTAHDPAGKLREFYSALEGPCL